MRYIFMNRLGRELAVPGLPPTASAQVATVTEPPGETDPQPATEDPVSKATLAGDQWFEAGAYAEALEHYEQAATDRPESPRAHDNLGQVLVRRGRHREALAHFEAAVQRDAGEWRYHVNFGDALAGLGWWDRAVTEYRDAAAIRPEDYEIVGQLGRALHEAGDPLAAIKAHLQTIELAPGEAPFFVALGASYEAAGRVDDAAAAYEGYLELSPDGTEASHARARLTALRSVGAVTDEARAGAPAAD